MIALLGHGSLVAQVGSLVIVGAFTIVVTTILIKFTAAVVGLRVDLEMETNGLDLEAHGERAYDMSS